MQSSFTHINGITILISTIIFFTAIVSTNSILFFDVYAIEQNINENYKVTDFQFPFEFEKNTNLESTFSFPTNTSEDSITSYEASSSTISSSSSSSSSVFASSIKAKGDYNGDGIDDLAIGVPFENIDGPTGLALDAAGVVHVIYGNSDGLSSIAPIKNQIWSQESLGIDSDSRSAEFFGRSLAAGDYNGDGIDDLAIGVQEEDVCTSCNAGAVNIIYGSPNGLSATTPLADQFFTQNSANIDDTAEDGDKFGSSLAAGDFNNDGIDDLAIGAAHESFGLVDEAGAVNIIYGSPNGLSATTPIPDQFWTQSSPNVDDTVESGENFGNSLAAGDFNNDGLDDLAIGVPGENVGTTSIRQAGAVHILHGSSNGLSTSTPLADQFWAQNSANVDDTSEAGDNFGSSLAAGDFNRDGMDDLAIGVPEEDISTFSSAGAVNVIYGSTNGLSAITPLEDQFWTQNSANVEDVSEIVDFFGSSLAAGDYNGDGIGDLAIGVPFEDVLNKHQENSLSAGAVNIIYGSSIGLLTDGFVESVLPDKFLTQNYPNVDDIAEELDSFGTSLAAGDYNGDGIDDLAIGVPNEDLYDNPNLEVTFLQLHGAVHVIYGSSAGISPSRGPIYSQFITQDSPGIGLSSDSDEFFGESLG